MQLLKRKLLGMNKEEEQNILNDKRLPIARSSSTRV